MKRFKFLRLTDNEAGRLARESTLKINTCGTDELKG